MWVLFNSDSNSYFLTFFISLMKFCCLCFSETFWFPIMKNKKVMQQRTKRTMIKNPKQNVAISKNIFYSKNVCQRFQLD